MSVDAAVVRSAENASPKRQCCSRMPQCIVRSDHIPALSVGRVSSSSALSTFTASYISPTKPNLSFPALTVPKSEYII